MPPGEALPLVLTSLKSSQIFADMKCGPKEGDKGALEKDWRQTGKPLLVLYLHETHLKYFFGSISSVQKYYI